MPATPGGVGDVTVVAASQRDATAPRRQDLVGRQFDARVVRVADGDTMEAIPSGESRPVRIRLQGIDAPELGEAFSREATTLLRTLTLDHHVRVDGRDMDRYGRLVARITAAGEDASSALVRAGLACHAYVRDERLARDESQARRVGAGFWAASATKPECVTRTAFSAAANPRPPAARPPVAQPERRAPQSSQNATPRFRGNTSSGVYHAATCPNATCRNCTRAFTAEAEAKAAGFRPAADCLK